MPRGCMLVPPGFDMHAYMPPPPPPGPGVVAGTDGVARSLLAPGVGSDPTRVADLAGVLVKALACPRDRSMRACVSPQLPNSFHCMFRDVAAAAGHDCDVS